MGLAMDAPCIAATAASRFVSAASPFATAAWRKGRARGGVGTLEQMSAGRAHRLPFMVGGSGGWGRPPSGSGLLFRGFSMRLLRGWSLCLCLVRLPPAPKGVPLSDKIAFGCTLSVETILSSGSVSLLAGLA